MRIEDIGAVDLADGVMIVSVGEEGDVDWGGQEPETPVWGSLGFYARPYPADASGAAQGLVLDTESQTCVAGIRDTRCVAFLDAMADGDGVSCTSGPNSSSCYVWLHESSKEVEIKADKTTVSAALEVGTTAVVGTSLEVGGSPEELSFASKTKAALDQLKAAVDQIVTELTAASTGMGVNAGATSIPPLVAGFDSDVACPTVKGSS